MKVSVIIPAYNAEQFIERSVGSVKGQSFNDWELIIIDDGSTDRTASICDNMATIDNRINVIHTSNRGAYMARLAGLQVARGEWLTFMDADDTLPVDAIATLYAGVLDDTVDIVIGGINMNDKCVFEHQIHGMVERDAYIVALLDNATTIGMCSKLFKRELFVKMLSSEIRVTQNEDLLMLLQLAVRARRVYVESQRVCYNYLLRNGSMSGSCMSIDGWEQLFNKIRETIALLKSVEVERAFLTMRFRRIYNQLILKGMSVRAYMPIVADVINDASGCLLSAEERNILRVINHPTLQWFYYQRYSWLMEIKRFVKRLIGL